MRVDGATVGEYSYNPYGQRVRKTASGQTTWFLYNGEGLAAEYDSSGNLIKEYHFKPNSPWMTEPLMQRTASGQVYYYQNDHLGTPQRMVDKSGAVVWEARYEAFGKAEILNASVENNLRFPGQYFDVESGLHHNYFRDYDSGLGRYLQSDPRGILLGFSDPQRQIAAQMGLSISDNRIVGINHLYSYSDQNPLMYADPTGEFPWVPVIVVAYIAYSTYTTLSDFYDCVATNCQDTDGECEGNISNDALCRRDCFFEHVFGSAKGKKGPRTKI